MENSLKQIDKEWYNGTIKPSVDKWPSAKENLRFHYSQDQREVKVTHFEDKKIGITFTEELTKRFDGYPELLESLIDIRNWYEQRGSAQLHPETPVCFSKALSVIQKHS